MAFMACLTRGYPDEKGIEGHDWRTDPRVTARVTPCRICPYRTASPLVVPDVREDPQPKPGLTHTKKGGPEDNLCRPPARAELS